jgi:hypothetical protein
MQKCLCHISAPRVCVTHSNTTIQAAVQAVGMHMYVALPEDEAKLPGNLCARTAH